MATRMRSPNYPSMPLGQAVETIDKMYGTERTNVVDREVAAQAIGYSGITGRSAKVLSDLRQYGLLEKAGKNEVRVAERAVDILHPDTDESRARALHEAATEPELFRRISERFPAGRPSEAALRSFFLREGFTDAAIPPARRAYLETVQYVQEAFGSESHGRAVETDQESTPDQDVSGEPAVDMRTDYAANQGRQPVRDVSERSIPGSPTMDFNWAKKQIVLGRVVTSKAEAQDVVNFLTAMMELLPDDAPAREADAGGKEENGDEPGH